MMRDCRGFTLVELMVAAAIIALGLVGLGIVIPLAGYGIQQGSEVSTAAFLATQRLEQVRNATWTGALYPSPLPAGWSAPIDCLGTSPNANASPTTTTCTVAPCVNGVACTTFADEATTAIASFAGYSRSVRVTDCSVAPGCGTAPNQVLSNATAGARLVTVTVTFTPITATGSTGTLNAYTTSVDLLVAQR